MKVLEKVRSVAAKVWGTTFVKEAVLMVAAAVGAQLALSLGDLTGAIDTARTWKEVWDSTTAWFEAASFAAVTVGFKQLIAWAIAHLAANKL